MKGDKNENYLQDTISKEDYIEDFVYDMLEEYAKTEEYSMHLLFDTEVRLEKDFNSKDFTELRGINSIGYVGKARDVAKHLSESSGECLDVVGEVAELFYFVTLYVDISLTQREPGGLIDFMYVYNSNKKNLKDAYIHELFAGYTDGVLDGLKLHLKSCDPPVGLESQVVSWEINLSYLHTKTLSLMTNLEKLYISLSSGADQYFHDNDYYKALYSLGIPIYFRALYYSFIYNETLTAALSLGVVSAVGESNKKLVLDATDRGNYMESYTKYTKPHGYKSGTMRELVMSLYPQGQCEVDNLKYIEDNIIYWKEKHLEI